jgi:hypothetical protein
MGWALSGYAPEKKDMLLFCVKGVIIYQLRGSIV